MIILAATPAFADHPSGHTLRMMPPLPLQAISSNTVHDNPFCGPERRSQDNSIQLTSGRRSVRLKPIDGLIGLHSIKNGDAAGAALTIEPAVGSVVRSNPLVESTHHENRDLVETRVLESGETAESAASVSTVSGENPASVDNPVKAGKQVASRNSSIVLVEPTRKMHAAAKADTPVAKVQLDSESVPTQPEMEPVKTEPVLFSLSDHDDSIANSSSPTIGVPSSPEASQNCPEGSKSCPVNSQLGSSQSDECKAQSSCDHVASKDVEPINNLPAPVTISFGDEAYEFTISSETKTEIGSLDSETAAVNESINVASLPAPNLEPPAGELAETQREPEQFAEDQTEVGAAKPIDGAAKPIILDPPVRSVAVSPAPTIAPKIAPAVTEAQPAAIYRSGSTTAKLKETSQAKLHDQRFRPPVSVTSVPISIDRNEGEVASSAAPATVEQVEEVALSRPATKPEPKAVVARNTKLTPLFMKSAQVRSLTVAGELKNVRIGDKGVCQAVAAGPNQLKLIGTGTGVTQLVVWAQSDDPNQPLRMRAFEVHVDQVDPAVQAGGSTAKLLKESIRDAFPGCRVTLRQNGGELIVSGQCDSEASAAKIIRMIRKTCLVPVQDQLIVR